jgi:hypothetical protein
MLLVLEQGTKLTTAIRTLHKIHTFVEAQQKGSKVKNFFHQGEMGRLLNECKAGLQQGFGVFEVCDLLEISTTH